MPTRLIPLLHCNDVYRVEQHDSKKNRIGADQFAYKVQQLRNQWPKTSSKSQSNSNSSEEGVEGAEAAAAADGLMLFSGDVFSPSVESSVTRGVHMIPVLKEMMIDCSVLGNHDFDFGFPHMLSLIKQTNFPWVFSNIADRGSKDDSDDEEEQNREDQSKGGESKEGGDEPQEGDQQVEGTKEYWVKEVNGVRIGIIGLVEKDWIATVPSFPPNFFYRSMQTRSNQLSKLLRDPSGPHSVDLIIALTHCRLPNDIELALKVGATSNPEDVHGVDLILGGHDHTYYVGRGAKEFEGEEFDRDAGTEEDKDEDGKRCMIVKSGTDFRDLSAIELVVDEVEGNQVRKMVVKEMKVKRHRTSPSDPSTPELRSMVDDLISRISASTGEVIAHTLTPWDARSEKVRTDESALGNFLADILMRSYDETLREREKRGQLEKDEERGKDDRQVDCALLCGGAVRGDSVYDFNITLGNVLEILPFEDATVVKELTGQAIWDALENGLSSYPKQEGRFPVIGGLIVKWDSTKPPFSRLVSVEVQDEVHMLSSTGKKLRQARVYSMIDHPEDSGATIKVHRPALKSKGPLKMDKKYRVVTREYMAEGHDGYEALTTGSYLIDHENGVLASALVRKFLLGASLLWRLKHVGDDDDEEKGTEMDQSMDTLKSTNSKSYGNEKDNEGNTISRKTKKAIERARLLAQQDDDEEVLEDDQHQIQEEKENSSQSSSTNQQPPKTPSKRSTSNPSSDSNSSRPGLNWRSDFLNSNTVDLSPGGIRDALFAGGSEHHSKRDPVHKRFNIGKEGGDGEDNKPNVGSGLKNMFPSSTSQDQDQEDQDKPKTDSQDQPQRAHTEDRLKKELKDQDGQVVRSEGDGVLTDSVEVNEEEIEEMKQSSGDLAIICPMRDGRLVDVAREKKK